MNKLIQLEVNPRTALGKKNKARRRLGYTPLNIVISGKPSIAVEVETSTLIKVLDQVGYTQAFEVVIGDNKKTVLVTDVSFIPLKDIPQHVVLFEVKKGLTVNASVPISLKGEAPGERKGLMILQMLNEVEVSASALNIPEILEADISNLDEDGDVVRLENITLPKGVTINLDLQTPIVRLEKSRSQISQEAEVDTEEVSEEAEEDMSDQSESDKSDDSQLKEQSGDN